MTGPEIDWAKPLSDSIETVRAVVISDIHATPEVDPGSNVAVTVGGTKENALLGAHELLAREVGVADLLLCPGDLVHQGNVEPTQWVWEQLDAISNDLGATMAAAVGNHDLLRTPGSGQSPTDALRELRPRFPVDDVTGNNSYWAHDFAMLTTPEWRVVTMNSCAMHGGYNEQEAGFGRFRQSCLRELGEALSAETSSPPVNICMIHHHPFEWTHKGDREVNHLLNGDLVIDMLDARPERWIVLHGHKHHPALGYLGHSTNGPVWIAAGSIGADVLGDTSTKVRNQLHVVDVAKEPANLLGLRLAGEIRSFDWEPGRGWEPAAHNSGLPARCGFGYRRDGSELLAELAAHLKGQRSIRWTEICDWDPRWNFLTPADRNGFAEALRAAGGGLTGRHNDATLEVTLS